MTRKRTMRPGEARAHPKGRGFGPRPERPVRERASAPQAREASDGWWGRQDSNLRRLSQRIYSPPPLPLGTLPR